MQINKQIITIVLLTSLLVSSIGVALFFYKKNRQAQLNKDQMITVYIAKEDIPKNTLISIEHLAQTQIAKQYILNTPLVQEEILGKFTNEKIFQHEIFIKQKLDTQLQAEEKKILEFEKSAYNVKFELFKNPNYALHQGEYLNIVSVFPKGTPDNKGRYEDFDVEYVAKEVKILGFIRDGRYESSTITKHKVRKVIDKKPQEVIEEIKADELILDIDLKVLLALIRNYNKGTQIWMVKTKQVAKDVINNDEKDEGALQHREVKEITFDRPIEYEYKMYEPKATVIAKEGLINYANDKEGAKTKSQTTNIVIDASSTCSSIKDKFIVGSSRTFNLRDNPSLKGTITSVLQKHTIIPYLEKVENWYKTCDNKYVHESVVSPMSNTQVEEKLGQYE
jgi:hypothetical protein